MSTSELNTSEPNLQPRPVFTLENRALRWIELSLVLAIAFAQPFMVSVATLTAALLHAQIAASSGYQNPSLGAFLAIVRDVLALALLGYVLFRQGRRMRDIGWTPRALDILTALGLAFAAYLVFYAATLLVFFSVWKFTGHAPPLRPANIPAFGLTLTPVLLMLVNPFYEELILRAHLQTDVAALTGSSWLALCLSVALQTACHFYQGVLIALIYLPGFTLFALYFRSRRRVVPIVLAHMFFDVTSLVLMSRRHL